MNALYRLILKWANDRNIVYGCALKDQYAKLMSEFGELCLHIDDLYDVKILGDHPEDEASEIIAKIQDDIGDCIVVLTILAAQNGSFIGDINSGGVAVRGCHENATILRLGRSLGLLGDAIAKNQTLDVDIAIAASVDYLSAISNSYGMPLANCVAEAYADIKDRKGIMYNGTFIKESDPAYVGAAFQVNAARNAAAAEGN